MQVQGGRAESAPEVRAGESDKATMASASAVASVNAEDSGQALVASDHDSRPRSGVDRNTMHVAPPCVQPCMPHLTLSKLDLDRLHPALSVPSEEELDDSMEIAMDARDEVYQHGMKLASQISDDMKVHGRLRRAPCTPPCATTAPPKSVNCITPAPHNDARRHANARHDHDHDRDHDHDYDQSGGAAPVRSAVRSLHLGALGAWLFSLGQPP